MRSSTARLLLLSLALATTLCQGYQLPELGNSSYASLPAAEEQRLGTLFMQQVHQSVPLIADPMINDYLNTLGKKLASHSTAHDRHFDFFMIDSAEINAFAGPAAHIGVNAGTLLLSESEDELASVLAHEITHVSQHHLARAMENARGGTLTAIATLAAALVVGTTTGQADVAMGGMMAAQTLSAESQLGYSRDNEREADRIGIQVLDQSGFDPQAMPRFLTRMSKQQIDLLAGRFSYLRTHPINEERIADAKSRANDFPTRAHPSSLSFKLMQMRLLALSGQYTPTKIKPFVTPANNQIKEDHLAHQYGFAVLLHRGRKLTEAENIMSQLHHQHPDNVLFALSLAAIYEDQHKLLAAEHLLEQTHRLNPDYPPLVLSYSQLLMQTNHAQKALNLLDNFVKQHPQSNNQADILEQLAMAQAKNGYMGRAYLTRARLYQSTDQPKRASLQTQQALKYAQPADKAFIENEMLLTDIH